MDEAGSVSGAFASSPCAFVHLEGAARTLADEHRPEGTADGEWVMVTVRRSPEVGHQAHLRERCRTAAQRFVLTLACEDVESVWVEVALDAEALGSAGVDMGTCEPVGLVWCHAG